MVWLVCEGGRRYFQDRCEYEINRIKKIRDNCNVMIKVGLLPAGSTYPNYNKDKWKEETELLKQLAAAEERCGKGLEPYEEHAPAGYIPHIPENHVKTPRFRGKQVVVKQEPRELPGPSSKVMSLVSQVVPPSYLTSCNSGTSSNYGNRGQLKQIDYNIPLPPLLELELLQVPDHMEKLTDLLVTKQLTRLSNTPVDIRKIYKYIKHDIPQSWFKDDSNNSDSLSDSEDSDSSSDSDDSDRSFDISCHSQSSDHNAETISDRIPASNDRNFDSLNIANNNIVDKKWKQKTRQYKISCSELFNQFDSIGYVRYNKRIKEVITDLHRIDISSDEEEDLETASQTSNTPISTSDYINTSHNINNNTSDNINNITLDNINNNSPENISNSTTGNINLSESDNLNINTPDYVNNNTPENENNNIRDNMDNIAGTRNDITVTSNTAIVPSTTRPDLDDDFEYLATIPDEYLMKLFTDDPAVPASFRNKISDNNSSNVLPVEKKDSMSPDIIFHSASATDKMSNYSTDDETNPFTQCSVRRNPTRKAKENVDYKSQLKEDILVSQYYCWKCKGLTIEDTICETHGDLLPCLEPVPNQKKKNPVFCPVPSFVKVHMSNIPNSGFGVIATRFIEPGQIIGDYEGKKITQEKYRELEKKKQESGYAWKVTKKDGKVVFIDGASYRSSNWLRYLNCARGLYEENVMCRVYQGKIQYYTCKTIAIGSELLVYYGDEYFTELGYVLPDYNKSEEQHHCHQCYKLFSTQKLLEEHVCGKQRRRTQKERKHKCDICGNMFIHKHHLTAHISSVHDKIKQHSCPYCQYRTNRKHNLTKHISSVHDKIKQHSCPYCQYRTNNKPHLTRHISTHTGEHRYKCTLCDYTTVHHSHFTLHMYRIHTNKSYKCRYTGCNINKPTLEELHEHIISEHPVRRYKCDMCPMSYDSSISYISHKLTHQDKQYQCKYCDKKFTQSNVLSRHLVTHTGEKKYTCRVCNKRFNQNGHLTTHMRIHTGEKPYSCTYCYMAFTQRIHCKNHEISCADRRY